MVPAETFHDRVRSSAFRRFGRAPRLPIAGDERKQVLKIIRTALAKRPTPAAKPRNNGKNN